jgi:hypothetical protein
MLFDGKPLQFKVEDKPTSKTVDWGQTQQKGYYVGQDGQPIYDNQGNVQKYDSNNPRSIDFKSQDRAFTNTDITFLDSLKGDYYSDKSIEQINRA